MTKIKGVTLTNDIYGNPLKVEIDLALCSKKIKTLLQTLHIIDEEPKYDPRFVAKIKKRENGEFIKFNTIDDLL